MSGRWELRQGEALALLSAMPGESVDAVVTDPPYSSGGAFRGDRTAGTGAKYVRSGSLNVHADFGGDNRDARSWAFWCVLWLAQCHRIARPGAPICMFTDWRQLPAATDVIQTGGFVWRGICVWDKGPAARPQPGRFRGQCEYIVWGSRGPMHLTGSPLPGCHREMFDRADKHHQTGKPTAVMRWLMGIVPDGGLVLDPFAGSGTTGVAALLEGRRFLGIEQDAGYADVARRRLAAAEGGRVLSSSGLYEEPADERQGAFLFDEAHP